MGENNANLNQIQEISLVDIIIICSRAFGCLRTLPANPQRYRDRSGCQYLCQPDGSCTDTLASPHIHASANRYPTSDRNTSTNPNASANRDLNPHPGARSKCASELAKIEVAGDVQRLFPVGNRYPKG